MTHSHTDDFVHFCGAICMGMVALWGVVLMMKTFYPLPELQHVTIDLVDRDSVSGFIDMGDVQLNEVFQLCETPDRDGKCGAVNSLYVATIRVTEGNETP